MADHNHIRTATDTPAEHAHAHTHGSDAGAPTASSQEFILDASLHCLDFINTLEGRGSGVLEDRFGSYADLVRFGQITATLTDAEAEQLLAGAAAHPRLANDALTSARDMREQMFAIFSAIAADEAPEDTTLAAFSALHRDLQAQTSIVPNSEGDGFIDAWHASGDLRQALWAPCAEAVDLLLRGPLDRVRECAGDDCRWIFLDVSRNQSRRWCSMKSCGNRAKVANFRERERERQRGSKSA